MGNKMPIGLSQGRVARVQLGYTTAGCPGQERSFTQWCIYTCEGLLEELMVSTVYSFATVELERSIENF